MEKIKTLDIDFYRELEQLKGKKSQLAATGEGLHHLPYAKNKDIIQEFSRLLGSYKSGNTNVYNALNDVIDQMRRSKILDVKSSKKLLKECASRAGL